MNPRYDELTAQYLQVGLIYKTMLGVKDAEAYLQSVGIPGHLIYRVLHSDEHRHLLSGQSVPGTGDLHGR
ncbi:hypothetical protein IP92_00523 [Pseudoduganella flava]|uniref:Uncharacterized protein n=1 Tax=Pseudoduganella flava TaxID=871742 RepID=A0A562Q676_9BURK|nr:hypothetical protein [Pseudoduganella flava]QGZ41559.1 hypothetical protein GO485_22550 [Pseudoduganella flava]TWI51536.1 hypothetical protein IP92_00523 [Pseudoduganella flava]